MSSTNRRYPWAALAVLGLLGGAVATAKDAQNAAVAAAEKIRLEVARMRGLDYLAPVKVGMKKPDEIRAMILEGFEEEAPVDEVAKQAKVYERLGLLPEGFDLRARLIDFLSEQIGGYYDPEKKELFLVDQSENPQLKGQQAAQAMQDEMVMAHELHHALQDQNFDLQRWFEVLEGHDDRILGYKSLVEGEAQLVGLQFLFKRMGRGNVDVAQFNRMQEMAMRLSPEAKKLREMPPYLVETMMFPYTQGAEFVQAMQRKHGWDRVTAAFAAPPSSSEQVLHPEKYFGPERDEPLEIVLPKLAQALDGGVKGWDELYTNVLGEFSVGLLLRGLGAPKAQAERAATGWDGDRFVGLEKDGRLVVVWVSTWDSEQDAEKFLKVYAPLLGKQRPTAHVERRGVDVVLVDGASGAEERERLLRRGFASLKVEQRLAPMPGMTARPPRSDFVPEPSSPAPGVASATAAPSGATPALVRNDVLGTTFALPPGWAPGTDPIEAIRQMPSAYLAGPDGQELRLLLMPISLAQAGEQLEALVQQGVQDLKLEGRASPRALGRPALQLDFSGVLPASSARSRARGLVVDLGTDSLVLIASAPAAGATPPSAGLDALLATLWVDGRQALGAAVTHGPARLELPAGFIARRGSGPWTYEAEGGARIQLVEASPAAGLDDAGRALLAQLPLVLGDFQLRSAGVVARAGRPVHELDYVAAGRRTRQVTLDASGRRWTLAVSAPSDRFAQHEAQFGRVLAAFGVQELGPGPDGKDPARRGAY